MTTIGEGINGQELLCPNTPLDLFHCTPSSNFSNHIASVSSLISNIEIQNSLSLPKFFENNHSTSHPFISIVDAVQRTLTTIGKGLHEQTLLNPNTPLDPFNYAPPIPSKPIESLKHMPICKAAIEQSHIPVMLFDVISLPRPPKAGMLPVLLPNGKLDWIVMSADWHKFKFSHEELENGIFHLDEHFGEFMSKIGNEISIVTSQNGINVTPEEFASNCESDTLKIRESMTLKKGNLSLPLYVGMYNPTQGLIKDLRRVSDEKKHKGTSIVESTRHLMTVIANEAHKINSNFLWLDLRHSEAGLIFCRAFEGMNENTQQKLHEHLLNVALGPAEPISNSMTKEAVNLYSEKDYITKRYAEPFMNHPDYDIRIIACISSRGEFSMYIADHGRAGTTYDTALEKQIRKYSDEYGFQE